MYQALKRELRKTATNLTQSIAFAANEGDTLDDVKKRKPNKSKKCKAYKIPRKVLVPELLAQIDYGYENNV